MKHKSLSLIRRILAVVVLVAIVALFVDPTAQLRHYIGWLADIQFLPAVLALNVVVVVVLLLLTWLLGRLYCSIVCPLGIMQDVVSRIGGLVLKHRFHYRKPTNWVRYSVLAAFVLLMLLGFGGVAMLIAPYGMFGRILTALWQGAAGWMTTLAVLSLVVVAACAFFYGRVWCNAICPVGSLLSVVSRYSLFGIKIDASKCVGCRQCEKACKSQCIDITNHTVDASRCVDCYNCLGKCKFSAIKVGNRFQKADAPTAEVDSSRRKFLATTAAVGATLAVSAQEQKFDGGLAVLQNKQIPDRETPIKPFGSRGLKHFGSRCVACQLCVSHCPEHILKPSTKLDTLMQPEMDYTSGYCRLACTRCSEVCPAGAIEPIDSVEKTAISIGYAVTLTANCLSVAGVQCGACSRHCPAGAVTMVADTDTGRLRPTVDESRCIGCGACEYYCPARPVTAIFVKGREQHKTL